MEKEDFIRTLDQINELPTLPNIYVRLNKLLRSTNSNIVQVSRIIETDQAISTKLLRLVNSSFFGFSRKITQIQRAVVLLGFNAVRNAVLSISVFQSFKGNSPTGFDRRDFWKHSIITGISAKLIAQELHLECEEDAFSAGIIHDLGKLVLDQFFPVEFSRVLAWCAKEKCSIRDGEHQVLGTDHAEIGEYLTERWNLPYLLVEATALHHTPSVLRSNPQIVSLVHIANTMAHFFESGGTTTPQQQDFHQAALEELEIDLNQVHELMRLVAKRINASDEILHLLN